MKPVPPVVQLSSWKQLYSAAQRVQDLKPWETLDDLDLVVVRDPATGETGHGVFMGSGGTLFGFCVYRGTSGFRVYQGLADGKIDGMSDDYFAILDCLNLEFNSRSELLPEDHRIIRSLGLSFKGKHSWPQFRSFTPGYAPWFISESEARFLTLCLNAGCFHCESADQEGVAESVREGEYLVYSPIDQVSGFQARWEAWPEESQNIVPNPVLNLTLIETLRSLSPVADQAWEVDAFLLPAQILDKERPYFLRMAVVCQESSGLIIGTEPALPEQSTSQMLVDIICSSAKENKTLPGTVFVKGPEEVAALAPLAKTLGFSVRRRKNLRGIRMFKKAALDQMA